MPSAGNSTFSGWVIGTRSLKVAASLQDDGADDQGRAVPAAAEGALKRSSSTSVPGGGAGTKVCWWLRTMPKAGEELIQFLYLVPARSDTSQRPRTDGRGRSPSGSGVA